MKSKLPFTKLHIVLEIICVAALAACLIYVAATYAATPEVVPMHYNIYGEIDRWANKSELLVLPVITAAMFVGLTILEFFPGIWNIPIAHKRHRAAIQIATRSLLIVLKIIVVVIFGLLCLYSINQQNLPMYFLPAELGAMAVAFVVYFLRIRTIKQDENN